jgi:hypothetical protein
MLRCVVSYKLTNVSEVLIASITIITLMMEAVSTSETLVSFCKTTQHNILEDSHLLESKLINCNYTQSHENLPTFFCIQLRLKIC